MVFFNKCCFCVPLRPGCLVIAYINLIGTILGIGLAIFMILTGLQLQMSTKAKEAQLSFIFLCVGVLLVIFLVLSLAFAVVLLVGLHKNKPKYVKSYLIFSLVFLIIYAILLLVRLITGVGGIAEGFINLLLSVYFLLVMKSYHQTMLENNLPVNVQKV